MHSHYGLAIITVRKLSKSQYTHVLQQVMITSNFNDFYNYIQWHIASYSVTPEPSVVACLVAIHDVAPEPSCSIHDVAPEHSSCSTCVVAPEPLCRVELQRKMHNHNDFYSIATLQL